MSAYTVIPTESSSLAHKEAWNYVLSLMSNDESRALDLIKQVQYWISDNSKKLLVILFGSGNNGKSLFVNTLNQFIDIELLASPKNNKAVLLAAESETNIVERFKNVPNTKCLVALNHLGDFKEDNTSTLKVKIINFDAVFNDHKFTLSNNAIDELHHMIKNANQE